MHPCEEKGKNNKRKQKFEIHLDVLFLLQYFKPSPYAFALA
jgi:hypothetical protein